ncbi:MAG: hypothetical protein IPF57_05710 [Gammaproteobacteria bacterium]|nr:hypothetical protein [Gammaproteobacteria bacterium]
MVIRHQNAIPQAMMPRRRHVGEPADGEAHEDEEQRKRRTLEQAELEIAEHQVGTHWPDE